MKFRKLLFGSAFAFALAAGVFSLSMFKPSKKALGVKAIIGTNNVMVNGRNFNAGGSLYYINGDPSDAFSGDSSNYNAKWDPDEQTLTLKDFEGTRVLIDSYEPVKVEILGENHLNANSYNPYGIKSFGNMTIFGDGSLDISVTSSITLGNNGAVGIDANYALTIKDDVEINITIKEVSAGAIKGLKAGNGVTISENAEVSLDLAANSEQGWSMNGIYTNAGKIDIKSSKALDIAFDSDYGNGSYAIYNNADDNSIDDNGDISFSGSGKVTLSLEGEGYADGIYSKVNGSENLDGLISFNGSGVDVEINAFAYAIFNGSKARASADYDILITNGAKVSITSYYESFAQGLYSVNNGILIDTADYSYIGTGKPVDCGDSSQKGSNESTYGFDIAGASHIDIKTTGYINTYSNAVSSINLSGDGYFEYGSIEGTAPDYAGTYHILQGSNTRMCREDRFRKIVGEGVPSGTYQLGGWSAYREYPVRFEGYSIASPSSITIQSTKTDYVHFSSDKTYFVNGDTEARASVEGDEYNARFDKTTGFLYLKGFDGGNIYYGGNQYLRIVLEEDSVINSYLYGLDFRGTNPNIEITTLGTDEVRLSINASADTGDSEVRGISQGSGKLTIGGFAYVVIHSTVRDVADDGRDAPTANAVGISVGFSSSGNFILESHASVDITLSSDYKPEYDNDLKACKAIYCQGKCKIDNAVHVNYHDIVLDASDVEGNSYGIYAYSFEFIRYSKIRFKWHRDGVHNGATNNINYLKNLENGELRLDSSNPKATLTGGDTYTVTVKNAVIADGADNNLYVDGSQLYFYAPDLGGCHFVRWENTGDGVLNDPTADYTWLTVHGDDTVYPIYDFVSKQPIFDTRGDDDTGHISFEFKGSPSNVTVVTPENAVVYDTAKVTKSTEFDSDKLPDGTYKLCVEYTMGAAKVYLYSDTFTVAYGEPAVQWNVTYHANNDTSATFVGSGNGNYFLSEFADTGFVAPSGKRFFKWAKDSVSGSRYAQGYQVTDLYETRDYYAIYEDIPTHTLTLTAGAGAEGVMQSIVKNEEEEFELPQPTFDHAEHVSFKWTIDEVDYKPGDKIAATEDMEAVGSYTILPTHTMSFNANGGTGNIDSLVKYSDEKFVLPACTFTAPAHKHFAYWEVNETQMAPGVELSATEDYSVKAVYTDDVHIVTFDSGEGTGSMANQNYVYGTIIGLPENGFTAPAHKSFKCWSIGGEEYEVGASYTVTSDITVTAVYEDILRTVTFAAGDGTGTMDPVNVVDGSSYTLPESSFVAPEGKMFDGWMVGSEKHQAGELVTIDADTTVTATFKDIPVTPEAPAKKGLSGGAIAGIVIGSTVVAGAGGFALVWFVIKKKTFAEFLAIFKKKQKNL